MNKIIIILLMGILPLMFSAGIDNNPYDYNKVELKRRVAILESSNNWNAYNSKSKAMGKYQFLPSTLKSMRDRGLVDASMKDLCKMNFLADTVLQEVYMDKLLSMNANTLKSWRYGEIVGTEIEGITISMEGMLAASHLLGVHSVDWYLSGLKGEKTGIANKFNRYPYKVSMKDGNGTPIEKYLDIMNIDL